MNRKPVSLELGTMETWTNKNVATDWIKQILEISHQIWTDRYLAVCEILVRIPSKNSIVLAMKLQASDNYKQKNFWFF